MKTKPKPIERTPEGVQDVLFDLLDESVNRSDLDHNAKVRNVHLLVGNIHKMGRLSLENKRLRVRAPGLLIEHEDVMRLGHPPE